MGAQSAAAASLHKYSVCTAARLIAFDANSTRFLVRGSRPDAVPFMSAPAQEGEAPAGGRTEAEIQALISRGICPVKQEFVRPFTPAKPVEAVGATGGTGVAKRSRKRERKVRVVAFLPLFLNGSDEYVGKFSSRCHQMSRVSARGCCLRGRAHSSGVRAQCRLLATCCTDYVPMRLQEARVRLC